MFVLSNIVVCMFLLAFPPQEEIKTVSAAEAKAEAGRVVRVCGIVAGIYESRRGNTPTILNFEKPYPQNEFGGVVWRWQRHRFGNLRAQIGQKICVTGRVRLYRGAAQMTLTKAEQLTDF